MPIRSFKNGFVVGLFRLDKKDFGIHYTDMTVGGLVIHGKIS